jgi:hypothetical protein
MDIQSTSRNYYANKITPEQFKEQYGWMQSKSRLTWEQTIDVLSECVLALNEVNPEFASILDRYRLDYIAIPRPLGIWARNSILAD